MPRPAKHDETAILNAAASLVASGGPGSATMAAIATAVGAPNGSIYHRFKSRDALLGRLWLAKAAVFQCRWVEALQRTDARAAGREAALSLPRTSRADFEGARILLLHRRDDFLGDGWSPAMRAEAERLGQQQKESIDELTRRLFGLVTPARRQVATFAALDLPYAAVRRYVGAGEPPPPLVDALITHAYDAVLDGVADGAIFSSDGVAEG